MKYVQALIELTAWAFNGVPPDDPRFEARLAEWAPNGRRRALAAASSQLDRKVVTRHLGSSAAARPSTPLLQPRWNRPPQRLCKTDLLS